MNMKQIDKYFLQWGSLLLGLALLGFIWYQIVLRPRRRLSR